jgi:hypothetical protein
VLARRAACTGKSLPTLPAMTAIVRLESLGEVFIYTGRAWGYQYAENIALYTGGVRGVAYASARIGLSPGVSSSKAGAGTENTDGLVTADMVSEGQ